MNRSFLYGDGFFETIRSEAGHIPLLDFHLERARRTADELGMIWPENWTKAFWNQKLQCDGLSVFRITFYRGGQGRYQPESEELLYQISSRAYADDSNLFISQNPDNLNLLDDLTNLPAVKVGIATKIHKPINKLSPYKLTSAAIYVQAGRELRDNQREILLLNHDGNICEGLHSNVLILSNGVWKAPALDQGPIDGTYLRFVSNWLDIERTSLSVDDCKNADQLFLLNGVQGFRRFEIES